MYVGHVLLAFALGGLLGTYVDATKRQCLVLATVAGGFGMIPDIDTVYTLYVALNARPENLFPVTDSLWGHVGSWKVHRRLTHSLVVGAIGTVYVFLLGYLYEDRSGPAHVSTLMVIVLWLLAVGYLTHSRLGVGLLLLYLIGLSSVAGLALREGLPTVLVSAAAAVGLLTHPFGDFFMGVPPKLLYPLSDVGPSSKLVVATDPTVNLVSLFLLEALLAWCALWTYLTIHEKGPWELLTLQPFLGGLIVVTVPIITPPTLQYAYHFALLILSFSISVGVLSTLSRGCRTKYEQLATGLCNAVATSTVTLVVWAIAFVLI